MLRKAQLKEILIGVITYVLISVIFKLLGIDSLGIKLIAIVIVSIAYYFITKYVGKDKK